MSIDPQIPLAAKAPQAPDLLHSLGDVMTIQEKRYEQSLRVQAAADQAALQEAMAVHPNDPDAVSLTLQEAGHGTVALKFDAAMAEQRKRHIETLKAENELGRAQLEQGLQVVQGIRDQGTLSAAKAYLQQHVPQLASVLPDQWDDPDEQGNSKAQQAVDYLRSIGLKAQEYNTWQSQLLDRIAKRPKTEQEWLSVTGQVMSGAHTPELWGIYRDALRAQGAPRSVLGLVPEQFDPEAPNRMGELGMTPTERQKAADDRLAQARLLASQAETARHNSVMEAQGQQRIDKPSTPKVSTAQLGAALRVRDARIDKQKKAYKWNWESRKWDGPGGEVLEDDEFQDRLLEIENSYRSQTNQQNVGSLAEAGWKVKGVNTPTWESPAPAAAATPASAPATPAATTPSKKATTVDPDTRAKIRALLDSKGLDSSDTSINAVLAKPANRKALGLN